MEPKNLQFKDLFDVTLKIGDKIDTYWRLFCALNLATVAWLTSTQGKLQLFSAVLAASIYAIFATFNGFALIRTYALLELGLDEVRRCAVETDFRNAKIQEHIKHLTFSGRTTVTVLIHVVVGVFVLYLFWQLT